MIKITMSIIKNKSESSEYNSVYCGSSKCSLICIDPKVHALNGGELVIGFCVSFVMNPAEPRPIASTA